MTPTELFVHAYNLGYRDRSKEKHQDPHAHSIPELNTWISSDVQLPPHNEKVLICIEGRSISTGWFNYDIGKWCSYKQQWYLKITHWQPLPALPNSHQLQSLTYLILEPKELEDPTECVITATLGEGSQLHYKLIGKQLHPNYLDSSSFSELLEQFLKENRVTSYEKILEEFVHDFDRDYISKAKIALAKRSTYE